MSITYTYITAENQTEKIHQNAEGKCTLSKMRKVSHN